MKNQKQTIRVAVVDDSDFFNSIISRHAKHTLDKLKADESIEYVLDSYLDVDHFIRNYPQQYDIVFLDYYLGNSHTALDILPTIDPHKNNISIATVSQQQSIQTSRTTISKGATTFIKKDKNLLQSVGFFIEDRIYANFIGRSSSQMNRA